MRLIHTSDWHLGRRLHGEDLHQAHEQFLRWLVALAVREDADAVLVSGDVYDRSQPGADAVRLLDSALAQFVAAGVPLVVSAGNHDSAVRLQYGGQVLAATGVHLRTTVEQVLEPVLLADEHGALGVYAIPYVLPDAVTQALGVARSHAAVLAELADRIRLDATARGLSRVVLMAHAFVVGGVASESEREIRVGGVGEVPAGLLDGFSYVALGHLHGPQVVRIAGSATTVSYSGSPLAFSFSERDHVKSVTVVEIDAEGQVELRRVPTPVPRALRQVRGRLADLLAEGAQQSDDLAQAYVKVVLTDPGRVASPMEQLREVWPHTLVLEFDPEGAVQRASGLTRATEASDPVEIAAQFVSLVSGQQPTPGQREVLAQAVAACRAGEVGV